MAAVIVGLLSRQRMQIGVRSNATGVAHRILGLGCARRKWPVPSSQPDSKEVIALLRAEVKRNAPLLAQQLFPKGKHSAEMRQINRAQFLAMVKHAWGNGVTQDDGTVMPPEEWRAGLLKRFGAERFWQIIYDAGLTTVRDPVQAASPPPLTGPKLFEEAVLQALADEEIPAPMGPTGMGV